MSCFCCSGALLKTNSCWMAQHRETQSIARLLQSQDAVRTSQHKGTPYKPTSGLWDFSASKKTGRLCQRVMGSHSISAELHRNLYLQPPPCISAELPVKVLLILQKLLLCCRVCQSPRKDPDSCCLLACLWGNAAAAAAAGLG
jgi:hypothetical protein